MPVNFTSALALMQVGAVAIGIIIVSAQSVFRPVADQPSDNSITVKYWLAIFICDQKGCKSGWSQSGLRDGWENEITR
jgi:hypothetical protein